MSIPASRLTKVEMDGSKSVRLGFSVLPVQGRSAESVVHVEKVLGQYRVVAVLTGAVMVDVLVPMVV